MSSLFPHVLYGKYIDAYGSINVSPITPLYGNCVSGVIPKTLFISPIWASACDKKNILNKIVIKIFFLIKI